MNYQLTGKEGQKKRAHKNKNCNNRRAQPVWMKDKQKKAKRIKISDKDKTK